MMSASLPILSASRLRVAFGTFLAVNDFSADFEHGRRYALIGPNGAGKTTLFEAISGLNPATSGDIIFEGRNITKLPPEALCHAGIARTFQLNAGFDSLTVRGNVEVAAYFGRSNRLIPGLRIGKEVARQVDAALEAVGLTGKDDEIVGRLPVLDRKLLMLAGALASNPTLLLMDEPVGGLNPKEIDQVMEIVRQIAARGVTIILIEHVMRFLVQLSTRVLIMHHGEKIYEGKPQGLIEDRNVVDVYLGEGASQRLGNLLKEQARA